MEIVSVKENPEYKECAIQYFQSKWAKGASMPVYDDSILHCITSDNPLPQWYLLENDGEIIGCAGLIRNDFISKMDLYPWICIIYIEEKFRGNAYGLLLLEKAKNDAKAGGVSSLYLCTDHIGYYEKYGFTYIGEGYHPWGERAFFFKPF